MIKNIVFDFGDIFIDLDKEAPYKAFKKLTTSELDVQIDETNKRYEKGLITTEEFITFYQNRIPNATKNEIIEAWNSIIKYFPESRLSFIEKIAHKNSFQLFLLSNTNELHIAQVIENMQPERYARFKKCFKKFYLSHEIHLRKPDNECFQYVLEKNNLIPEETLFVDDSKTNTDAAMKMGIHIWNLVPGTNDIVELLDLNIFKQ